MTIIDVRTVDLLGIYNTEIILDGRVVSDLICYADDEANEVWFVDGLIDGTRINGGIRYVVQGDVKFLTILPMLTGYDHYR